MGDLDYADSLGAVKVDYILNGGYSISPGKRSQDLQKRAKHFLDEHKASIDEVIGVFGKSTAKGLELLGTIHYAHGYFKSLGTDYSDSDVVDTLQSVKPGKFSDEDIQRKLTFLREKKVIAS